MVTLLGIAVQDSFFRHIYDAQHFLGDMVLAFGLIGFTYIVLTFGRISMANVIAWAVLFMVLIVRPVGEPLFFTKLDGDSAPILNEAPCMGGQFTQDECSQMQNEAATQQGPGIGQSVQPADRTRSFMQRLEQQGYTVPYAFTPQLALISVLNRINVQLAHEFLAPGRRMLDGYYPAISALTRGRLGSDSTAFHMEQFLDVCAMDGAGASDRLASAYIPYGELERQNRTDILRALNDRQMTAYDGYRLLQQYGAYLNRSQPQGSDRLMLPPLICPIDGCGGRGAVETPTEVGEEVMNRITRPMQVREAGDFQEVQENWRSVLENVRYGALRNSTSDDRGGMLSLREQPAKLAIPLNAHAIAEGMDFESAEEGTVQPFNLGAVLDDLADGVVMETGGCLAGAAVGGKAGAFLWGVGAIPGAALGCVAGYLVGRGMRADGNVLFRNVFDVEIGKTGSARLAGENTERVYVVENCADFHRLTDARLYVDVMMTNRLTETLTNVLSDGNLPEDFANMTMEEQAMVGLHNGLEAMKQKCSANAPGGSTMLANACIQDAVLNYQRMIAAAQTHAANNTLNERMAEAYATRAGDPRFVGNARNIIASWGGFLAPPGLTMKATWGGFEAGTYAKIMPMVVMFGTSLIMMLTPFIYAVGLLVPGTALSVLLIPLIGVAYLQLVKITFTIINILASIFIEADSLRLLEGTDQHFPDIILGWAYGAAFMISAGVLYALRDPSALVKGVATKGDAVSTISGKELLAMGAMAGGLVKGGGAALLANPRQLGKMTGGSPGLRDQFMAGRGEALLEKENTTFMAEVARRQPAESRSMIQDRAHAKVDDVRETRAAEEAKGMGVPAIARKPQRHEEIINDEHGSYTRMVEHDPSNIELGNQIAKTSPGLNQREADHVSNRMFASGAATVTMDGNVPRIDLDVSQVERTFGDVGRQLVQQLRTQGRVSEFSDAGTRKHVARIIDIPAAKTRGKA